MNRHIGLHFAVFYFNQAISRLGRISFVSNEHNGMSILMKIKISRKEAKETGYWLSLLAHSCPAFKTKINELEQEAKELMMILSAIMRKSV